MYVAAVLKVSHGLIYVCFWGGVVPWGEASEASEASLAAASPRLEDVTGTVLPDDLHAASVVTVQAHDVPNVYAVYVLVTTRAVHVLPATPAPPALADETMADEARDLFLMDEERVTGSHASTTLGAAEHVVWRHPCPGDVSVATLLRLALPAADPIVCVSLRAQGDRRTCRLQLYQLHAQGRQARVVADQTLAHDVSVMTAVPVASCHPAAR